MSRRPPRVPGRILAWTALAVALGASVAANVAYARPTWGPRLSAGVAPVLVVLAAGLLERVSLAGVRWWRRYLAYGGLGSVIAAAFITSFEHQYALLLSYGNTDLSAALLPIAVDGLIVLASVCLTVIADRRRELLAAAEPVPAVSSEPVPAPVEAVDEASVLLADLFATSRPEPISAPPAALGDPEPVPALSNGGRRVPVPDRRILAALRDPEAVPRRSDGTVAVREVERRWGCRQDRAIRLLRVADLYRAGEGEPVPAEVLEPVPAGS